MNDNQQCSENVAELRTLLVATVLGDASEAELARLNDLLLSDAQARDFAAEFLADESLLRRQFEMLGRVADFHNPPIAALTRSGDSVGFQPAAPYRRAGNESHGSGRNVARIAAYFLLLAASVLVAVGTIAIWKPGQTGQARNGAPAAPLLPALVGVVVDGPPSEPNSLYPFATGTLLRIGDVISTPSGVTNLRFNCGVEVLLKGPAELEVISPMRAALRRGTLTARVEEAAHGFQVDTPNSKVTDLGTEFGLSVDEKGATNTVVFSGKVALQYAKFQPPDTLNPNRPAPLSEGRLLTDGEAMRITELGEAKRLVAVRSSDYPFTTDKYEEPSTWAPIIDSVSDNLREGSTSMCYRIVHRGFREDARAYVDRRYYEWNGLNAEYGLPRFLRYADYVMPFCNDKLRKDLEVRVALNRAARVYVLIDNRVELPEWLTAEFQDTGYDIGLDETAPSADWFQVGVGPGVRIDKSLSVWCRDVVEGSTVVFGPMKSPKIQSVMYGIAAVPLEMAAATEAEPIRFHQPRVGSGLIRNDLLPSPKAEVFIEHVDSFAELTIATPAADDAASSNKGVVFRIESNDGKLQPHKSVRVDGDILPGLNDGQIARNHEDLDRNVWYDGQGRFSVDLQKSMKIAAINTFSWHRLERAPQYFTLWGSNESEKPSTTFDEAENAIGWEFLGLVNTSSINYGGAHLNYGGVHASSLRGPDGQIGPYRHLLWIAEDTTHGTFFTEIDVHEATP
ncbi:MAG: FecR family protein [Planctomycetes bacterium]|nr:FecR family protein [Planctomycetota bacterium]